MKTYTQSQLKLLATDCANKLLNVKNTENFFTEPYKHCFVDNFFPIELAKNCLESFPNLEDPSFEKATDEDIEVKYRTNWQSEFDIPEGIIDAIRVLNSSIFLRAMSEVMGIKKLVADQYFTGGGLNAMTKGGLLDIHVDGNYHDATGLTRRLNAIVFLNLSWKPEWGGEFGVYAKEGDVLVRKIPPLFNRLVIFDSNDYSFHGIPDPINFPEGEIRKSIILYYYTKESRPLHQVSEEAPHSALWKKRGLLDKRGNKNRKYE